MVSYTLNSIYLHITEYCEHRCKYCYASEGLGGFKHAEFANLIKIIDKVSESGVKRIALVGGDPMLHPQIEELLIYIKNTYKLYTTIMTNTAQFRKKTAKQMAPFIDCIMVTIHGDTAEKHDTICEVEGAYDALVSNLKQHHAENIIIEVAYNIAPYSYDRIYSSIVSLIHQGVRPNKLVLQRIAPTAKDKLNEEFAVNKNQVAVALDDTLRVINKLHIPVELVDPFPLCFIEERHRSLIKPCKCGFSDMSINGYGDTSRCGADPTYAMGNILQTPILEIWQNAKELCDFRNRSYLPVQCQSCKLKLECAGGCAMSCSIYNSIDRSHLAAFQ